MSGRVLRGPVTPVCMPDIPCDQPFAGDFDVERGGRRVLRFRSSTEGDFSAWLPPGDYLVRWVSDRLGQAQPVEVAAPATTVTLHFDTGSR